MIISKTPYRISFFGGGSDYPDWYKYNPGEVISTTIDKYLYISIKELPSFYETKYRIYHSKVEKVNKLKDIRHHVIRKGLNHFKFKNGLEIHYNGEIPPRSGMGSSSSFVVGFLNLIYFLQNKKLTRKELATNSIFFEQKILNENVGSQDQIAASYGGFNSVKIFKKNFSVNKIKVNENTINYHNKNMMLVYTGMQRTASIISNQYTSTLNSSKKKYMYEILNIAKEAKSILIQKKPNHDFGKLLHETWKVKKMLSKNISNIKIDNLYNYCINEGAVGGKILGAGAGGFLLLYISPENQKKLSKKLKKYPIIPFRFSKEGSKIIKI